MFNYPHARALTRASMIWWGVFKAVNPRIKFGGGEVGAYRFFGHGEGRLASMKPSTARAAVGMWVPGS